MISATVSKEVSNQNHNVQRVETRDMDCYIQSIKESHIDTDVSFYKYFAKSIITASFYVKEYLVWSGNYLLEQPGITTIYPSGPNNGVSLSKFFLPCRRKV